VSEIVSKTLKPTAAEAKKIAEMKLPRFVDRKNVVVVRDEETGERQFVVQQDLPAYIRRGKTRTYTLHSSSRKVQRHEWRDAKRRAKTLHNRIRVKEGETIELPGGEGERLFYTVLRSGWFHARYHERMILVRDKNGKPKKERRRIVAIDNGPGAAQIEADLDLYEGFREVPGG
jgi:hypothetical protein